VRPIRDILAGLFFISMGMLVDLPALWNQLPMITLVTLGILLIKAAVAIGAFAVVGTPLRIAVTAGIGLAQVGEFSFILGRAGLEVGLLTADQWQILLAASIATMIVTPALIALAPRAGLWLATKMKAAPESDASSEYPKLSDHVIIPDSASVSCFARRAANCACRTDHGINGGAVRRTSRRERLFGDATSPDALKAPASIARAPSSAS
jgi:CPA2 family monovalent cation:H+ antiporter-2